MPVLLSGMIPSEGYPSRISASMLRVVRGRSAFLASRSSDPMGYARDMESMSSLTWDSRQMNWR